MTDSTTYRTALGKHEADESSVAEILGLTGMYASLFTASAWRFRAAAEQRRHRRAILS